MQIEREPQFPSLNVCHLNRLRNVRYADEAQSDLLDLVELYLDRGRSSKDLHGNPYAALLGVDLLDDTGKAGERSVDDLDGLPFVETLLGSECLFSLYLTGLLKDVVHLILRKWDRLRGPGGGEEPGHALDALDLRAIALP